MLALGGVVLASREEGAAISGRTARGAGLAVVSALGFGFFFLGMDRAATRTSAWAMLVNRITGVTPAAGRGPGAAPASARRPRATCPL